MDSDAFEQMMWLLSLVDTDNLHESGIAGAHYFFERYFLNTGKGLLYVLSEKAYSQFSEAVQKLKKKSRVSFLPSTELVSVESMVALFEKILSHSNRLSLELSADVFMPEDLLFLKSHNSPGFFCRFIYEQESKNRQHIAKQAFFGLKKIAVDFPKPSPIVEPVSVPRPLVVKKKTVMVEREYWQEEGWSSCEHQALQAEIFRQGYPVKARLENSFFKSDGLEYVYPLKSIELAIEFLLFIYPYEAKSYLPALSHR